MDSELLATTGLTLHPSSLIKDKRQNTDIAQDQHALGHDKAITSDH